MKNLVAFLGNREDRVAVGAPKEAMGEVLWDLEVPRTEGQASFNSFGWFWIFVVFWSWVDGGELFCS